MNLGDLIIGVSLNTRLFLRQMGQVTSAVGQAGRTIGNSFGSNAQGGINATGRAANQMNSYFKDTERIVGGILISQAFYSGTQAIKQATAAVMNFTADMEDSQVALEYFLGSQDKAKAFVSVMQDFAATTNYTTQQAVELSKSLLNAGFAANGIRSVLTVLADAGAASGLATDQIDRLVLALSQVRHQGFLSGQEIRQFANANIPILKILQQELGLTQKQLANIGDLKINGDQASIAILRGLEKQFAGAAARIANNMHGMMSTIQDDAKIISSKVFDKPYKAIKGFVTRIRNTMETARTILSKYGGVGGLFKHFVPDNLKTSVKAIIGGFQAIGKAIGNIYKAVKPTVTLMAGGFVKAFGVIIPYIAILLQDIGRLANAALNSSPAVKVLVAAIGGLMIAGVAGQALAMLWRITRIGVICAAVGKVVLGLAKAIQILALAMWRNKLIAAIMVASAALIYFARSNKIAGDWIDNLIKKLSSIAGINLDGLLSPEYNNQLEEDAAALNGRYDDMVGSLKNVGKEAAKAGKKVKDKFVASFDELFQVPDSLDEVDNVLGNLDLGLPDMSDLFPKDIADAGKDFWDDVLPDPGDLGRLGGLIGALLGIPPILWSIYKLWKKFKTPPPPPDEPTKPKTKTKPKTVKEPKTEPVKEPVKQPKTEPVKQPKTEPVKQPKTETVKQPKTEPVKQPSGSQTNDQVAADIAKKRAARQKAEAAAAKKKLQSKGVALPDPVADVIAAPLPETAEQQKRINDVIDKMNQRVKDAQSGKVKIPTPQGDVKAAPAIPKPRVGINSLQDALDDIAARKQKGTSFSQDKVDNSIRGTGRDVPVLGAFIKGMDVLAQKTKPFADFMLEMGFGSGVPGAGLVTGVETAVASKLPKLANFFDDVVVAAKNIPGRITTSMGDLKPVFTAKLGPAKTAFTNFFTEAVTIAKGLPSRMSTAIGDVKAFFTNRLRPGKEAFTGFMSDVATGFKGLPAKINAGIGDIKGAFTTKLNTAKTAFTSFFDDTNKKWNSWVTGLGGKLDGLIKNGKGIIDNVVDGVKSFNLKSTLRGVIPGYASGGIVNKQHLAMVGEGNKREAIIPLTGNGMAPFAKAVADELGMKSFGNTSNNNQQPILYVGTLIADDRSLKELERKMQVIRLGEQARGVSM